MVREDNITKTDLIKKASADDLPFEDFKKELKNNLNIDVALTEIMLRSDSCFRVNGGESVPYLTIYTLGDSYEQMIGMPEHMGLCDEKAKSKIIQIWRSVCIKYGLRLAEYYDSRMYVGITRFETLCFSSFAYTKKEVVQEFLLHTLHIKPRNIYASSMPGINIVYETKDYKQLNIGEKQVWLANEIKELAIKYVSEYTPMVKECNLRITFYHPEMKTYNAYGLARQD